MERGYKMNIAVIFGGKSTEHDISLMSGTSVIANLDKDKYHIFPIYQDTLGNFYEYKEDINNIKAFNVGDKITNIVLIDNIINYLKDIDVVFPVLHGLYGEDGSIQGMLFMLGKKYVGSHVLASSLCLDKIYTKALLNGTKIDMAKYLWVQKQSLDYLVVDEKFNRISLDLEKLDSKIKETLSYPVFIKPSNLGSSVGVNKASNKEELKKFLDMAFLYDSKVLIEEEIKGREVECAILGNDEIFASTVGEIVFDEDFYSYNSKYINEKSKIIIPVDISITLINEIKDIAKRAYFACGCQGLARIDFFIQDNTNRIILNEINTMPGFTKNSMYPKLMEYEGYSYSKLLDKLIELAVK